MADLSLIQALNQTFREEMRGNPDVVVLGEDVGRLGGLFGATEGLLEEFGDHRVLDVPAADGTIIGTSIGMAMYGMRPVPELQFADSALSGFDQIVSEMAKLRYRSAGQYRCPLVLRVPYGAGVGGGIYQSGSPEAYFCHTAGLVVVAPSNPYDAAGLMRSALRADDPVVFLEPKSIYRSCRGEVPEEDFVVPLGKARVVREGSDLSVFTYGAMVQVVMAATESAAEAGIQAEVVDLRTLMPFDVETVLGSVARTGRALIVSEAAKTCSFAAEIAATLAERTVLHLEAPVLRVSGYDCPVPYAFENEYLPDHGRVYAAIEQVANF